MSVFNDVMVVNRLGKWEIEANDGTDGFSVFLNGEFFGFADDLDDALLLIDDELNA